MGRQKRYAMIHEHKGDITTVQSGIICHGVNCQGVMGRGVALAIRNKWPDVYTDYRRFIVIAKDEQLDLLGHCYVLFMNEIGGNRFGVANMFIQKFYGTDKRKYVSYDAVDKSFEILSTTSLITTPGGKTHVHFPLIGCGLAGGHWPIVREIIEHRLPDEHFEKHLWKL